MDKAAGKTPWGAVVWSVLCFGFGAAPMAAIFLLAPREETMGDAQRILYVHVSVAWFGLLCFLIMAGTGVIYLLRRDLSWDHWSQSAAELGWLCTALTLITGSLWAHAAWNTWWTWDPRLATTFVLWAICSAYLIVRGSLEDPHRRARLSAVLAILGAVDLPLVIMATGWFRGIHPAAPDMEPPMRAVLLVSIGSFSVLFSILLKRRRAQLRLAAMLALREEKADI